MWLITRPFVYAAKLITKLLGAPRKAVRGKQRRSDHKAIRDLKRQG
ncbi:MAG: hypothetical protein JWM73_177 [Solirubrobacterales bacterium]|jgi:hypothetical protein|nr:hypothetical protein [Solirubrobacterales bacterium]